MNYSSSPTSSTGSYYDSQSRPASVSPTLGQDPMIFKMRYDAGRGFDPDDDYEFCPKLTQYPQTPVVTSAPVTSVTPAYKPVQDMVSPVRRPTQLKKALEIINPATGLRVGSPKPKH